MRHDTTHNPQRGVSVCARDIHTHTHTHHKHTHTNKQTHTHPTHRHVPRSLTQTWYAEKCVVEDPGGFVHSLGRNLHVEVQADVLVTVVQDDPKAVVHLNAFAQVEAKCVLRVKRRH